MAVHCLFMQPSSGDTAIADTAQEFRQFVRAGLAVSDGVGGTQGVTNPGGWAVTQRGAGANFSVDIAGGLAYVLGDDVTNQGTYHLWNDGVINVTTPSPPVSGTDVYRLVLQVQDKLNNGTWTGYTGVPMLLPSTSGGGSTPPAEPNSAMTLAFISIASGQASVQNSNITDYRPKAGPVVGLKTADLARTHATTLTDDPDLQLLNLQASAWYEFAGEILFTGGSGAAEGDLSYTFRYSGITKMRFRHVNRDLSGNVVDNVNDGSDTSTIGTFGTGTDYGLSLGGFIHTGSAPCAAVMQWAQGTDTGTATTLRAGSWLRAKRIA